MILSQDKVVTIWTSNWAGHCCLYPGRYKYTTHRAELMSDRFRDSRLTFARLNWPSWRDSNQRPSSTKRDPTLFDEQGRAVVR